MLYHMIIIEKRGDGHMESKLKTLFDYVKNLCEADLDRIIKFVLGIVSVTQQHLPDRPRCPHCKNRYVIKYGHKDGKQRFLCKKCAHTFTHTTNTLMENSHYSASVWTDFIKDTLCGIPLDESAEKFNFSHQTAFTMRHKVLLALQDMLSLDPVILSGIAELDETFVLDCYKGSAVPPEAGREARKHGARAQKRGISNEYVAICTGIQRNGSVIAQTVNRAKPTCEELEQIFAGHIADNTVILTDGLKSYNTLKSIAKCAVIDVNCVDKTSMFNLNTVNSLHSYIKSAYDHYRGVATKYLNRYNALFSIAFRCATNIIETLFSTLCSTGRNNYWHSVNDTRNYQLVTI